MFRTSNPVLREETFAPGNWGGIMADLAKPKSSTVMTLSGTIIKSSILLLLCVAAALVAARMVQGGVSPMIFWIGGALGGFVLSLIISFVPKTAPFLAPVYAIAEGAFLGTISLMVAARAGAAGGALVMQAVALTMGIFAAMLVGFSLGVVRAGSTMMKIITIGTMGICLTYLANFILSLCGVHVLGNAIWGTGMIGIGFSLFVVVMASLNLVLDFQRVEEGIQSGAPKHMEWYAGFGLLVTLVWLYLEVLRLLSKLNRR